MVCNSRVRNRTLRHAALAVIVWTMLSICLSMLYITDGFTAMKDLRHFGETRTDKVQRTNEEAVSKRYCTIITKHLISCTYLEI